MTVTISAWRVPQYGNADQIRPVNRPQADPEAGEVLIQIQASAVTRADGMMRAGEPRWARPFLGWRRPRRDLVGTCFSGVVVATGPGVSRFCVGDPVFGEAGLNFGANASHICLPETGTLMIKPTSLSHEEAAVMCDGPLTSYNFLRHIAGLRRGEKVLVLGASGSLGSAAVQIAADLGAEVSGSCSAGNAGLVASLGASHVIDYTTDDFAQMGKRYDVIYDTLGVSTFAASKPALTKRGRYVCPVLSGGLLWAMLSSSVLGGRRAKFSATGLLKPNDLCTMLQRILLMVEDKTFAPVMDRTYPLAQLIQAHRYMETGRKRGNVVVV
ncbi:MAG: NAD(P)-dependent alcohol dehydrogenase [Thalassovita sp.]